MSYDISINYGNVSITGIEIDVDLSDILEQTDSEVLVQELKDRGEYSALDNFEDDELTDEVVNRDAERDMLDKIDNYLIIDHVGAGDLLSEMDDEDILAYVRDNELVDEASLDEAGTDELVTELMKRDELDAILSQIDSEFIQDHMEKQRGGFTLENVPTEDLINVLEHERNVKVGGFTLTSEVIHAARVLNEFTTFIFNSKDGYEGKRFAFPQEG